MRALLSFIVSTTLFASLLWAGVAAAAEPFNWSPQVDDPIHTPAELVESMHSAFGYNHCRAVHAKGIILQGEFTPDTHAKEITKAPHLQGPGSKVTVRFSDFEICQVHVDPASWSGKVILNVAGSGKFSSDRMIAEYAADIWDVKACPVS